MRKVELGGDANRMCELYNGECIAVMNQLIAEGRTVKTVICDPPYG